MCNRGVDEALPLDRVFSFLPQLSFLPVCLPATYFFTHISNWANWLSLQLQPILEMFWSAAFFADHLWSTLIQSFSIFKRWITNLILSEPSQILFVVGVHLIYSCIFILTESLQRWERNTYAQSSILNKITSLHHFFNALKIRIL